MASRRTRALLCRIHRRENVVTRARGRARDACLWRPSRRFQISLLTCTCDRMTAARPGPRRHPRARTGSLAPMTSSASSQCLSSRPWKTRCQSWTVVGKTTVKARATPADTSPTPHTHPVEMEHLDVDWSEVQQQGFTVVRGGLCRLMCATVHEP